MNINQEPLIVIFCHKKDFFLAKICIASIRYYYPDTEVYLLKDYLNGHFNSSELEKTFNVKILDLGIKKYGWAAGKMHFILSDQFPDRQVLILDADIVFVGKLLEDLLLQSKDYDFAVNRDDQENPDSDYVRRTYYNYDFIRKFDPSFNYPGYLFNTGQMVVKTGKLHQEEVFRFFDLAKYPYWKLKEQLPLVDQSLLNYILPKKEQEGNLKIAKLTFMKWSESRELDGINLEKVKSGEYDFLIHWAGATRIPCLQKMSHCQILFFFEDYYYKSIRFGTLKKRMKRLYHSSVYYFKQTYRQAKRIKRQLNK